LIYKINFDIAVVGNNRTAFNVVENVNTRTFDDYSEAKQTIDDIANELINKNLPIFEDVSLGIERHCIAFSLTKATDTTSEEVVEYFFVELNESLDKNHRKEMKN
jgi:hypothetical protein